MEWAKFLVFSFGFGGAMLAVFLGLIVWFVKVRLPRMDHSRDAAVDRVLAVLENGRDQDRKDRIREREDGQHHFAFMMSQQIEERRRERKELLSVLDRLDRSIVQLSAKIDTLGMREPVLPVQGSPCTNDQRAHSP